VTGYSLIALQILTKNPNFALSTADSVMFGNETNAATGLLTTV